MQGRDGSGLRRMTPVEIIDAGGIGAADGLLLVLRRAMRPLKRGQLLEVRSTNKGLRDDMESWCRMTGNTLASAVDAGGETRYLLRRGDTQLEESPDWGVRLPRRQGGQIDTRDWLVGRAGVVPNEASASQGFVPRGAVPEAGMPAFPYVINKKEEVWADSLPDLYEQAKTQHWNPTTDIRWGDLKQLPDDLELAVCQLMTFLAENEYSALYIPAKFLPRINPQFVEPVLFLATMIQDEARHVEAFTKRALANGGGLRIAANLTEWSLHSLLLQEDYFRSSFLLHVLGEGTFLDLLHYIEVHAPDPVTADIARRARADEGRHVAYGIAHARYRLERSPDVADELVAAAEDRSRFLQHVSGENLDVLEALAVLGGGGGSPAQVAEGMGQVRRLYKEMDENRVRRMLQIGLSRPVAEKISMEHTPNFM